MPDPVRPDGIVITLLGKSIKTVPKHGVVKEWCGICRKRTRCTSAVQGRPVSNPSPMPPRLRFPLFRVLFQKLHDGPRHIFARCGLDSLQAWG